MNLAISNFAWENNEHEFVFRTLKENNINKIETVLTKINNWDKLNQDVIKKYKDELTKNEIEPYSIQSLFYNVNCENFCDRENMLSHFETLIKYSKILDAKVLVLGSPTLRVFFDGWKSKLVDVFSQIDMLLESSDIKLVIEPNCSIYGGKYFKTLGEIVFFLDINNFRNIKTMIDTHNSLLENSDPMVELIHFFDYIQHIHVSEIKLEPLKDIKFHEDFSKIIKKQKYDKAITFELGKCEDFSNAVNIFANIYGQ